MSVNLGHFELHDQIGQGGMGTVFSAYDPSLNRNVAIKLLDEELAQDPRFVEDFLREAQTAAAISHAQIVPIYFVGEQEGQYYIVMELLNGRSLSAIVQEGPISEQGALGVAINIAEALKAAYASQMIHGDVKPQNIFVTESSGAKLLDFGLAKLANVEVAVSEGVWGSAYYVSPERVGRKAEDFRSDIYSLGATIFEALAGRPPFQAETTEELTLKRLTEKPPLLRTLNPEVSRRTEQIINKMLAKNPLLRYLDYDSLIGDLRKAEAGLEGKGEPGTETSDLFRTTGRIPVAVTQKSPLPLIIIACVAVIIAVGAVAYVMTKKSPAPVIVAGTPTPVPQAIPQLSATPLPTPNGTKIYEFRYRNADAKEVLLAGNFDFWHPEPMNDKGNGNWTLSKELPRAVVIEYQYIVDGQRQPDPKKSSDAVADEKGVLKSVMVIPKFDPTPHPPKPKAKAGAQLTPPTSGAPAEASAPMAFNLNSLAAAPADWPKTILLTQPVVFPAVLNGKMVGEVKTAPGTRVNLVNIESGQLVVEFQGAAQRVPVTATNLVQAVQAAHGQKYNTLP